MQLEQLHIKESQLRLQVVKLFTNCLGGTKWTPSVDQIEKIYRMKLLIVDEISTNLDFDLVACMFFLLETGYSSSLLQDSQLILSFRNIRCQVQRQKQKMQQFIWIEFEEVTLISM
ncbi:Hypothetical protein PHPALM_15055 [Phytophthora palmivora]|uniref:Uncharacterized protein n=1 Tax=Phytophthora palmivora TaxID=4796 RepID=A0A2P4XT63_9STRA|nr:Hypothetical protein PHPALM_15055 [Phytophthora palmivora]